MRSHSYLNSAKTIIASYEGSMPLSAWLTQYFKANKKFGSTDRKQVAHLCYSYYRLGNSFKEKHIDEKIMIGAFLCSPVANKVIEELRPDWNSHVAAPLEEKIDMIAAQDEPNRIFPFPGECSKEVGQHLFNLSFLIQPNLYLRTRPGKKNQVLEKLHNADISFQLRGEETIELANGTKVDEVIQLDAEAVVQDLSSQKIIEVTGDMNIRKHSIEVWDCCAASGGKSILFADRFPQLKLTVSDVRESILLNLKNRFKRAGIRNYDHFVVDLSTPNFSMKRQFDVVICDAPCSGSGTWSRTPEQLTFFEEKKIVYYTDLQKKIAKHAAQCVKADGFFLYITCSVFTKENEEVVAFLQQHTTLRLHTMRYFNGYDKKADTLFAALFLKGDARTAV